MTLALDPQRSDEKIGLCDSHRSEDVDGMNEGQHPVVPELDVKPSNLSALRTVLNEKCDEKRPSASSMHSEALASNLADVASTTTFTQSLNSGPDGAAPRLTSGESHMTLWNEADGIGVRCIDRLRRLREPMRSGRLSAFVEGDRFGQICMCMIFLNCGFTIYMTNASAKDLNEGGPTLLFIDRLFLIWYTIEVTLKLTVHRLWFFFNEDYKWNTFDFTLVFFGLLELAASGNSLDITFMRVIRLLRISKVLRLFRAVRFLSELRLVLNCVLGSITSLLWASLLLAMVLMMFALVFVQGITGYIIDNPDMPTESISDLQHYYGSVQGCMLTLFQSATGGMDWHQAYDQVVIGGGMYGSMFIFYVVFFTFSVCNIVTSVFIDKAMQLAGPDMEDMELRKRRDNMQMAAELKQTIESLSDENEGYITLQEFMRISQEPQMRILLDKHGLCISDAKLFFKMLTDVKQSTGLPIDDFVDRCVHMKGAASSADLLMLSYGMTNLRDMMRQAFTDIVTKLPDDQGLLSSI